MVLFLSFSVLHNTKTNEIFNCAVCHFPIAAIFLVLHTIFFLQIKGVHRFKKSLNSVLTGMTNSAMYKDFLNQAKPICLLFDLVVLCCVVLCCVAA